MKIFNLNNRENFGQFVSIVGICANILLSGVKIAVGLWSGAVSIVGDALNNLSDAGTSAILLAGFRFAAKPADSEHPFGHGRAEYLAGLIVALAMILVGSELIHTSILQLINPDDLRMDSITLLILAISVVIKLLLGLFYRKAAKKIDSATLETAALDSFTDCLATGGVIVSVFVYLHFGVNIDGYAGIFVAIFILRGGFSSFREILDPLLGDRANPELIDEIKNFVTNTPEILNVHNLIVHNYGVKHLFVSMRVEIPATLSLLHAHKIIERLEHQLMLNFGIVATLHVDPVVIGDKFYDENRLLAQKILSGLNEQLSIHNFRVEPYKSGRKLIFDVFIPQNFPLGDRELKKEFQRRLIELYPNYRAEIHLYHQFY